MSKQKSEKQKLLDILDNMHKELEERNQPGVEIEFECACVDGDYEKVERMLDTIPYLTKDANYIKTQVEFVEEAIQFNGSTPALQKVLELLTTRMDCQ